MSVYLFDTIQAGVHFALEMETKNFMSWRHLVSLFGKRVKLRYYLIIIFYYTCLYISSNIVQTDLHFAIETKNFTWVDSMYMIKDHIWYMHEVSTVPLQIKFVVCLGFGYV